MQTQDQKRPVPTHKYACIHNTTTTAGEIPTSLNYVQIVDCFVALYDKLQQHATCPKGAAVDSGPFCASYHMPDAETVQPVPGEEDAEAVGTAALTVTGVLPTNAFSGRSSMYFFLQNTMQEFPYAWWYKCIALHSAKISSTGESIHCSEWRVNPIQEHEMLEQTSIYDEPDVRGTLLLINGGVTSAVLRNVTKGLKGLLFSAF